MPKIKLTAAAVERLKAPAKGQIDYFDASYPGLALRITSKGVRSWSYFGRVNGKLRRVTLGRVPDVSLKEARQRAGEAAERMREGIDLTAAKRAARAAATEDRRGFPAVAALFIERYARRRNKDWRETARLLGLKPDPQDDRPEAERALVASGTGPVAAWSGRQVDAIRRGDVIELLDRRIDDGAGAGVNRLLAAVRKLFAWCVERDMIETNPAQGIKSPVPEVRRDRMLSETELRHLWRATEAIGRPFGPLVRLLILTGVRLDEAASATWPEIDLERALWTVPGTRMKNGEAHDVPLSGPALALLAALPRIRGTARERYVFTTTGRTPVSGFSRAKRRLDDAMLADMRRVAVESGADPEAVEPPAPWRLHDLRRTVASGMAGLGFNLPVIEKVLAHTSGSFSGIVGVYQRHDFAEEKRRALDTWARHVEALVEGRPANVVALRAEAKP